MTDTVTSEKLADVVVTDTPAGPVVKPPLVPLRDLNIASIIVDAPDSPPLPADKIFKGKVGKASLLLENETMSTTALDEETKGEKEAGIEMAFDALSFTFAGKPTPDLLRTISEVDRCVTLIGGIIHEFRKDMSGGFWTSDFVMFGFTLKVRMPKSDVGMKTRQELIAILSERYPNFCGILSKIEKGEVK